MTMQPAAGARDLLPQDVRNNSWICTQLSAVYRRWGYQELMPPTIERLDTLGAAGAIRQDVLLKLATQDDLGLRPEMTASMARAAATRLATLPRPLRLWYGGSVFQGDHRGDHERVQEELHSGIELIGSPGLAGDGEVIAVLLDACRQLPFLHNHVPTVLMGHSALLAALLQRFPASRRDALQAALTRYDALALQALDLTAAELGDAQQLLELRGAPEAVLAALTPFVDARDALQELRELVDLCAERARQAGVRLQLDPTFLPEFEFYDGVVMHLVCESDHALVALATGGRYNGLIRHFAPSGQRASGIGFSFKVERLRGLLPDDHKLPTGETGADVLVAYSRAAGLHAAMTALEQLHGAGTSAELLPGAAAHREQAEKVRRSRGIPRLHWVDTLPVRTP